MTAPLIYGAFWPDYRPSGTHLLDQATRDLQEAIREVAALGADVAHLDPHPYGGYIALEAAAPSSSAAEQSPSSLSVFPDLPTEILAAIFADCNASVNPFSVQAPPWSLSHVCGRWRTVALFTPTLWTTVVVNLWRENALRNPIELLRRALGLSKTCALTILFDGDGALHRPLNDEASDALALLILHSKRWKTIDFRVPFSILHVLNWGEPLRLDQLEECRLSGFLSHAFRNAPRLRTLECELTTQLTPQTLPWSQLTKFSSDKITHPSYVLKLLQLCPSLQSMKLTAEFPGSSQEAGVAASVAIHASLETLLVSNEMWLLIFSGVALPSLSNLTVGFMENFNILNNLLLRSRPPVQILKLDICDLMLRHYAEFTYFLTLASGLADLSLSFCTLDRWSSYHDEVGEFLVQNLAMSASLPRLNSLSIFFIIDEQDVDRPEVATSLNHEFVDMVELRWKQVYNKLETLEIVYRVNNVPMIFPRFTPEDHDRLLALRSEGMHLVLRWYNSTEDQDLV